MELSGATLEELKKELERRESLPKIEPIQLEKVKWDSVYGLAIDRANKIVSGEPIDETDDRNYMLETVLMTVFGDQYWTWESEI